MNWAATYLIKSAVIKRIDMPRLMKLIRASASRNAKDTDLAEAGKGVLDSAHAYLSHNNAMLARNNAVIQGLASPPTAAESAADDALRKSFHNSAIDSLQYWLTNLELSRRKGPTDGTQLGRLIRDQFGVPHPVMGRTRPTPAHPQGLPVPRYDSVGPNGLQSVENARRIVEQIALAGDHGKTRAGLHAQEQRLKDMQVQLGTSKAVLPSAANSVQRGSKSEYIPGWSDRGLSRANFLNAKREARLAAEAVRRELARPGQPIKVDPRVSAEALSLARELAQRQLEGERAWREREALQHQQPAPQISGSIVKKLLPSLSSLPLVLPAGKIQTSAPSVKAAPLGIRVKGR